jgi:hypothetical protein
LSLSRNLLTQASISTVRPRPPLIQEGDPSALLYTEIPLTLPRTPPEPPYTSNSNIETRVSLGETALTKNTIGYILTPNDISLITIRYKELPYSQLIILIMLPLYLQLNKLSLTLNFLRVSLGYLLITQVEDTIILYKEYYTVNIEDIPTTTKLRLSCS